MNLSALPPDDSVFIQHCVALAGPSHCSLKTRAVVFLVRKGGLSDETRKIRGSLTSENKTKEALPGDGETQQAEPCRCWENTAHSGARGQNRVEGGVARFRRMMLRRLQKSPD